MAPPVGAVPAGAGPDRHGGEVSPVALPPCCECGRPVADPLFLVHVACERTARADAMHALLSGPPPVPGRLPARDAARLLALIGEPLGVYRLGAGIYGGTVNASADRAAVVAFARRAGAVAVVPADLVCIDVDGKDDEHNLVPGLEAARMAALRAAGIDPATAVTLRSQSGTGAHLWWRAGAHRWPGKASKLPLPEARTVEHGRALDEGRARRPRPENRS